MSLFSRALDLTLGKGCPVTEDENGFIIPDPDDTRDEPVGGDAQEPR